VTRVRRGDEVYFCDGGFGPTPGTYQEVKVVDEQYLAHKPERLSCVEAGVYLSGWTSGVGVSRDTAYRCFRERTVLVRPGGQGI
jgi:NADPH2:quinone reductase